MDARRALPPIEMAGPDAAAAMVRTLSLAFADDPALSWIIPDRVERLARFPRFFRQPVRDDLAHGFALTSPDSAVVTLWRNPGEPKQGLFETLKALPGYLGALGPRLRRAMKVGDTIAAHHPSGFDYLYLHYAAVTPERQGQGLAGAAIRAGQARARAAGLPAFLETATQSNVGLYARLGFEVIEEYDVAGGGPHFWAMLWRPAD